MATWFITGANRGIGLEFARQACAAGHEVIATARRPDEATDLRALAARGALTALALDAADPDSVAAARRALGDRPIHVLVNNAGIIGAKRQSAFDMDFEGFAQTLAVNALGPLRVTQALLPNLERERGAKVAAISSALGSIAQGGAYQIAYSASKAALNRVMRALAGELKGRGVAVGIYSPGWVRTDMGGAGAPLSPRESVAGLMQRIAELDVAKSGEFVNWDGKPLPW